MATAIGAYATTANVKTRLTQTGTAFGAGDDTIIGKLCDQTNGWIESKTGRVLAPLTYTAALFDGFDALEGGRLLPIPRGLRTVSLLRCALYTGAGLVVIPASDYFIQPASQERDPGWPGTELWMTDIPSASNTVPYFANGYATIEITGTGGWAAMPDEIVGLAEKTVVALWRTRTAGGGQAITIGTEGEKTIEMTLTTEDWRLIRQYAIKQIEIV